MYKLFHVPTGTFEPVEFRKTIEIFEWLDKRPDVNRAEWEIVEYHEITRYGL